MRVRRRGDEEKGDSDSEGVEKDVWLRGMFSQWSGMQLRERREGESRCKRWTTLHLPVLRTLLLVLICILLYVMIA
jgi:hypothetical protein